MHAIILNRSKAIFLSLILSPILLLNYYTQRICMFICYFYWTDLQAHITLYALFLINLRILKPFFIFVHTYCFLGTYRIAGCAATAFFFSLVKNWYWFIIHYSLVFSSHYPISPQNPSCYKSLQSPCICYQKPFGLYRIYFYQSLLPS